MSNYKTKEQLNKITQSFSQIFDIKLSKVRHKIALKEGYTCHEAHLASLQNEPQSLETLLESYPDVSTNSLINKVKERSGMFLDTCQYNELVHNAFDVFVGNFKSNKSSEINLIVEDNEMVTIFDNSTNLEQSIFDNNEDFNVFNSIMPLNISEKTNINVNDFGINKLFIINALSENFDVCYKDKNSFFNFSFKEGEVSRNKHFNESVSEGLHIRFKINKSYLEEDSEGSRNIDIEKLYSKIQDSSFLNKGLEINVSTPFKEKEKYMNSDNVSIFNKHFNEENIPLGEFDTISRKSAKNNLSIEAVLVDYEDDSDFECRSYMNDKFMEQGGKQEEGFKKALKNTFKKYNINEDLKGIKAILLINVHSYNTTNNRLKVTSKGTEKEVFNLITTH
jgi:DNA gyrase/topoisomerase IV subunit B